jgi:hypothetical protein
VSGVTVLAWVRIFVSRFQDIKGGGRGRGTMGWSQIGLLSGLPS